VTDDYGCTASAQFTVPPCNLTASITQIGNNLTLTPIGGQAPYNYTWTGMGLATTQTIQIAKNTVGGVLLGTVTDAEGCTGFAEFNVTTCNLTATIVENGNNLTVYPTGGLAPYSYAWSNTVATTQSVYKPANGFYTVTVSDAGWCTATIGGYSNSDSVRCVTIGNNYTLNAPSGFQTNQYNWYRNGQLVDVTLSPTLIINTLQISDTGQYKVTFASDAFSRNHQLSHGFDDSRLPRPTKFRLYADYFDSKYSKCGGLYVSISV
jgi:hypothetical protein